MQINKAEHCYFKVLLYQTEESFGDQIGGKLELVSEKDFIEIKCVIAAPNFKGNLFELWLIDERKPNDGLRLGKFQRGKEGQGIFYSKLKNRERLKDYSIVMVVDRKRSIRTKSMVSVLSGKLFSLHEAISLSNQRPTEELDYKPEEALDYEPVMATNYLWEKNVKDFPQLLEQMMEKVEVLTAKANSLERRSRATRSIPLIQRVEPFKPSLPNYKWWYLGNR